NRRGDLASPRQVVIVGLDQTSIDSLNQGTYPIPRRWMAHAIDFLHHAGARAIGLDFLFIADSQYGPADDRALVRAMKQAGNVVVGQELTGALSNSYVAATANLESPIDPIARAAAGVGLANVPLDADGKVRGANLMQFGPGGSCVGCKLYPSLAVAIASVA